MKKKKNVHTIQAAIELCGYQLYAALKITFSSDVGVFLAGCH